MAPLSRPSSVRTLAMRQVATVQSALLSQTPDGPGARGGTERRSGNNRSQLGQQSARLPHLNGCRGCESHICCQGSSTMLF